MVDYGSHRRVLETAGAVWPVRRVVEFGAGRHSTPLFLDRAVFPVLSSLITYESDQAWAAEVRRLAGADERLTVVACSESDAIDATLTMQPADLAFVDGLDAKWRVPTAKAAARKARVVVIHDAENPTYHGALAVKPKCYVYTREVPWTAVLVDSDDENLLLEFRQRLETP